MKNRMLFLLLFPYLALAQTTVDVEKDNAVPKRDGQYFTVSDAIFSPYKYVAVVAGTPFFSENWMKGIVVFGSGRKTTSRYLKLDLLSGEVVYKDSLGRELVATNPISGLLLTDSITGKDYIFRNSQVSPFSSKASGIGWYQELETGTAVLYKKINKSILETRPFNSATFERTINTKNLYFIDIANDLSPFKTLKDITNILSDKREQLREFITTNNLKDKTEATFIEVVAKYNLLATSQ